MIVKPGNALRGTMTLPGDKSISHRAILFAALADGESVIDNVLVSGVTEAMLRALTALGVPWQLDGTRLTVQGGGLHGLQSPSAPIDCGNSATTIRLLAGVLAGAGVTAVLDGSPGLRRRPMRRVVAPLQQMGVALTAVDGCAPLTLAVGKRPLQALTYTLPVASAQVKSCLLLAALAAAGPTTLTEPGPSRDHTERMLRQMGVQVEEGAGQEAAQERWVRLYPPETALRPLQITIPGDMSSAAFLLVAALLTPGSLVTLAGVGLNPTRTGLLDALRSMGADIAISNEQEMAGEPMGDITLRAGELHGTEIGGDLVVRMIDEFPAFAVAAALAEGQTTVRDALELRHKESDRITMLCQELQAVGADVTETADGFVIYGKPLLTGGTINPHRDHRLAMSLAVAGLRSVNGITVQGAEIINESFPSFAQNLSELGAAISV
ncbi:MAG: 3-phosphoshikimate 1-carboxyvinyltransferase [Ardenticatenaceae bacterium]|nr:3-phosphoshikimate 1-carboxyvinyltransferase [Ardenticatenaceae bacterium]